MHNFDRYLDPHFREEIEENQKYKEDKKIREMIAEETEEKEPGILEQMLRTIFRHLLLLATIIFILLLVIIEPVILNIITPSILIKIFGLIVINSMILYIYGRLISVPNLKFILMVECSIPISLVIMITTPFNLFFRILISVIANIMFFFIGFEYNVELEKMFSLNGYIIVADLFILYGFKVFLG
jgi:hypothetical protein